MKRASKVIFVDSIRRGWVKPERSGVSPAAAAWDEISSSSWIFNSDASELFVVAIAFDFDTEAVDASVDMVWWLVFIFPSLVSQGWKKYYIAVAFFGWFDVVANLFNTHTSIGLFYVFFVQ